MLLSIGIVTASAIILAGPFATADRLEHAHPSACDEIAQIYEASLVQAMALAAWLIALRRFGKGDGPPPT